MTIKPRATQIAPNTTPQPQNPYDLSDKIYVDTSINAVNSLQGEINADSVNLIFGQPVYLGNAGILRADASNFSSSIVLGIVGNNVINIGQTGTIIYSGIVINPHIFWDQLIMGGSGVGLIPNSYYFLDPNNIGMITTNVPNTPGNYLVKIGLALSATELQLSISDPILL